ncbi:MAG: hypothetical protein AAF403_00595 [Pseudomonadota bacterium]
MMNDERNTTGDTTAEEEQRQEEQATQEVKDTSLTEQMAQVKDQSKATDWRDGLSDDVKKQIESKGFESPADLAKSYVELQKNFHERNNAPQDGYQFKAPDHMNTDQANGFVGTLNQIAKGVGLNADQAQKLNDTIIKLQGDELRQAKATHAKNKQDLIQQWGGKEQAQDVARDIAALVKNNGARNGQNDSPLGTTPDQWMDNLADNPRLALTLHRLAQQVKPLGTLQTWSLPGGVDPNKNLTARMALAKGQTR